MKRGNVLVVGNSGVGKSTLINAVLGEEATKTGWGTEGTTKELAIFYNEALPFRIIDTVGFEPSLIKKMQAIHAVKKWSKNSAKEGNEDSQINVIWFCVDGTAGKLFAKTLNDLSKATEMWKNIPVIVVITKSYSIPDREKNMEMVNNAFAKQKRYAKNLRKVIPVVASTFILNDTAFAPPEGITELIDATNELMPEGIKASELDIKAFKLNRKRVMAHSITGASTTAAVIVGAVPIPFADAAILAPIEAALVNSLALIYEIQKNVDTKQFLNSIVEVGTVGMAAKTTISGLKAIPGLNLGAAVLNAIVAGVFVAAFGEGAIYVFEQVYLGKKSIADIDWIKKSIESKFSSQFTDIVKNVSEKITGSTDKKNISKIISDVIKSVFRSSDNNDD